MLTTYACSVATHIQYLANTVGELEVAIEDYKWRCREEGGREEEEERKE